MDSSKIEREADSDNCTESDMLSISDKSSEDHDRENKGGGGREPKNKMKLRSFKLSRLPSLRSCVRPMKSPSSKCPALFSGYTAASSEQSNSDARKESFQKSAGSSFKLVKSLAKMSSMKFRRPLMRKSSGETDLKKKTKKTRSIKPASSGRSRTPTAEEHAQCDQPSESCYSGNDQKKKASDASMRAFKRTATLRPQRVLTKTVSLKSKRSSMKKSSEVSDISDPSINRATCSSALKDAKFPHCLELQPGGSESEGISAMKVCTYSYCSLHGHRHGGHGGALPPLKRFVSLRRRSLKSQKSMKQESCSVPKGKRTRSSRKGAQTSQMVFNGDSTDQETAQAGREISSLTKKVFKDEFNGADGHGRENVNGTTKPVKSNPEANDANKEEKISASRYLDGDDKPILIVDNHQIMDYGLPELKDSIQSDDPSLMHDDVISTPVDAKVHKELNGDTVAHLNLERFKGSCEMNIEVSEASTVTWVINEEKLEDSEPSNDFQEGFSQSGDSLQNYAADQSQKSHMGKPKYIGLWGLIYRHMASGIATQDENELPHDGKDKTELVKDGRTMSHRNDSVSDQSASGTDEDKGMGDHNAGDQKFELWQSDAIKLVKEAFDKILSEIPDQSSDDQSVTSEVTSEQELLENNQCEGGQQSISSYCNCTKESSVQEPEEPQMEADNINNTSGKKKAETNVGNKSRQPISKNWSNLKKVIILKRFVKVLEKVNKLNPRKPRILPIEADPETEKVHLRHQAVEERRNADEWMLDYALRQVISTLAPAQKRKVALLVQAFETVTPLPEISTNLRSNATASSHSTPRQVSTDFSIQRGDQKDSGLLHGPSYPEMSIEDAMDQVSNLPSAEKQILGKCSGLQKRSLGFSFINTTVGPLASETTPSNLKEDEEETATFKIIKGENNSILTDDQPGRSDVSVTNPEEPRLSGDSSKPDNSKSTSYDRKILLEVSEEVPLASVSELHDRDIKINSKRLDTGNLLKAARKQSCLPKSLSPENFVESTAVSSVLSPAAFSEPLEEPRAVCGEEANTKYKVLQKFSALEESEPSDTIDSDTIDMEQQSKLEKQKYMRLWYLLYKHMVSDSTEAGRQPIPEGSNTEEQGSNNNALLGMKDAASCKDFLQMNQKLMDNQNPNCQKIECDQIEAIKIIEEAIDEIPLPDIQDDSMDDPSVTGNMIPEQELQEKHSEDGEIFFSTSTDSSKHSFRESNTTEVENDKTVDSRKTRLNSKNIPAPDESEAFSKSSDKSKPQVQKNWSNLKKVILLKRFIKSLEKVRKFNPREPRYLPLEPDKGAEKVHLRHQNMEDRKNAEEWMLDHTLQQVVAKLTPARKRKVELLVEAFETVTPMLEVKAGQRHGPAVSPQPRLINA